MLISIPTEQDASTNLCNKLRTLPTLIEVYVLLVDQVMRKHGFDPDRREFVLAQALAPIEGSREDSIPIRYSPWPEGFGMDSPSSNFEAGFRVSNAKIYCEEDLLALAF
jgi:hypothetical protein